VIDSKEQQMKIILSDRSKYISDTIKKIKEEANNQTKEIEICTSMIHMFLNRLLRGNHRKQEMILYYFLYKHLQSIQAIDIKNKKNYA
jgi:thiopeptide-type bacteriocin biosynthesis protein